MARSRGKKKKKSKADLQKKKERKIHSVEGQFEGMAMPDFSGVALNENLNFQSTEQSSKTEKSHKNPYFTIIVKCDYPAMNSGLKNWYKNIKE